MIAQIDWRYTQNRPGKALTRLLSYGLFEGRPLTTRGQFINPLVFCFLRLARRGYLQKPVEKPVFIIGAGRSGTTVLGIVLSLHKDLGFLNEPKALWHSIYPYEDIAGNYCDLHADYRLDEHHADDLIRTRAHRLFGAYLALTRNARVLDKYPELIFRVPFVKAIFPDARFILLIRNGWDTCSSISRWSQRNGQKSGGQCHDGWGRNDRKWHLLVDQIVARDEQFGAHVNAIKTLKDHTERAVVEWIMVMREGLRLLTLNDPGIYRLCYEKLTRHPGRELVKLLDFLQLSRDARMLDYACDTLKPPRSKPRLDLPPLVEKAFRETLLALGY